MCENDPDLVSRLAKRLGVPLNFRFYLEATDMAPLSTAEMLSKKMRRMRMRELRRAQSGSTAAKFARAMTVKEALTRVVDITSLPRKSLLRVLAEYTTEPAERHKLLWYACSKGSEDYDVEMKAWNPTLLELLETFPSCHPPLERLLPAVSLLSPRYYSISNSPVLDPSHLHFAFSVVEYETVYPTTAKRKGVCTSWLERIAAGYLRSDTPFEAIQPPVVDIFISPAADFRLPDSLSDSIVMIGPGTGVAPFRGFLQHRQQLYLSHLRKSDEVAERCKGMYQGHYIEIDDEDPDELEGAYLGDSWLYFGCRSRNQDYLYREDLEGFVHEGVLSTLRVAFSRETDKKVYVQDLMREDGEELINFVLENDAYIYICGDGAAMAKDVEDTLISLLEEHGKMAKEKAVAKLREWKNYGRYVKDVWS
uniref:FAD-binding FR-type domain-containing protein n=1 Tax=Palpitomonas bilix TaxID=652834 RepID=A0A7S3GER8_9EUKA